MGDFNELVQEIIILSEVFYKEKFRVCFVDHLLVKIETLLKHNSFQNSNDNAFKRLQIKLLEPIMYHLRNTIKSTDKQILVQYLLKVLNISLISDCNVFIHLYTLIFLQIFDNGNLNYQISEELKVIVFEAAVSLVTKCEKRVFYDIFKPESGEKLSIGIFLSVQAVKHEKCIQLRLKALNFLLHASHYLENTNYNQDIYKNLGDLFMLYLPGILGPLQEIILRNETQHHLITLRALSCWGHIICLVLNDFSEEVEQNDDEILKQWVKFSTKQCEIEKNSVDNNNVLSEKKRTKRWLKAASETLKPLIIKVTQMRNHPNSKCRLELLNVMIQLHKHCKNNLQVSLNAILETLVASTLDTDECIRNIAEKYVHQSLIKNQGNNEKYTVFTIETNFCSVLSKLPGVIHSNDEKLILILLQSLSGYMKILGEGSILTQVFSSLPILQKLFNVIEMGFTLVYYSELSNEDFSPWDEEKISKSLIKSWKKFKHFHEESIRFELERVCCIVGKYGDPELIIDYLLDTYTKKNERKKEILLILSQVILGVQNMNDFLVNQILNFYLDSKNLSFALQMENRKFLHIKNLHSNIIQIALIMEGIRSLAKNLKSRFQNYILKTLYMVVECMGSKYSLIRLEANKAAIEISIASSYEGNITLLIKNNIDYLTYHSANGLKRNKSCVFDVMTIVISCCSLDKLSSVEEIINNVLNKSYKNFNSPFTISFLRLLHTFVTSVRKWEGDENIKLSIENAMSKKHPVEDLTRYLKNKEEELQNELNEEKEEGENGNGKKDFETETIEENLNVVDEIPASKLPPKHVTLILSVSNHCLHYLASKDKEQKLIALEILNESVLILHPWENELLPLVHKIWSPLMTRFEKTSDSILIKSSFNLLCTLAFTSKQFIRSRTLRLILPKLQTILLKEADKSKFKTSSSGYYFTQNFKLQRALLENLGNLTINLGLFEKQTDLIIESAIPYLNINQPKCLQEKCLRLFSQLKSHDPYLIWFKLFQMRDNKEYSNNVKKIID